MHYRLDITVTDGLKQFTAHKDLDHIPGVGDTLELYEGFIGQVVVDDVREPRKNEDGTTHVFLYAHAVQHLE
jgi:hypothetical protein